MKEKKREHLVLRYDHTGAVGRWEAVTLKPGQPMRTPSASFRKLDDAIVEQETAPKPPIE